jgi:hypothetical protein
MKWCQRSLEDGHQPCRIQTIMAYTRLLLFNPWRNLKNLKNGHDSFSKAFVVFENVMADKVRRCINHIQSYYESNWSGLLGEIRVTDCSVRHEVD